MSEEIKEITEKAKPILEKYGIKHAGIFGSYSRGDYRPDSDVDIMIEPGNALSLFVYMRLIADMEKALGRRVDIVTRLGVNKFLKPYIMADLKTIYED